MPIPVKLTRAHQVTLPKRLLEQAGWLNQEFFVADLKGDYLILKPLTIEPLRKPLANFSDLRQHFTRIGITQRDVREAVAWARRQERTQASFRAPR
jgi:bifunctional DNA-binding transcriptional regulator/antitoxin component of YhaV-PrlF toxin-antitoxin module